MCVFVSLCFFVFLCVSLCFFVFLCVSLCFFVFLCVCIQYHSIIIAITILIISLDERITLRYSLNV